MPKTSIRTKNLSKTYDNQTVVSNVSINLPYGGIFGVLANYPVLNDIIKGLTKLEYRGYDSSGVAVLENKKIHL